jgi:hypothetical protein
VSRNGPSEHARPSLSPLLAIYLNDHLAGEAGVLDRARRARSRNRENNVGTDLGRLIPELEEDRRTIEDVIRRLGFRPSGPKVALGRAGEKIGRLKLNGRVLSYSPLSRILDLEILLLATEGKRSLWGALRDIAAETEALAGFDFDALIKRAERQREVLRRQHSYAVARAFFRPRARGPG